MHTCDYEEIALSTCQFGCHVYQCRGCNDQVVEHLAVYGCRQRTEPAQAAPTIRAVAARRWLYRHLPAHAGAH